jgi:hypothetical protein
MKKLIFTITIFIFVFLANVSAQLKVNSTGQVGIGTANPQYKLDVTGDTRVSGNVYLGSASNFFGTTNNTPITFKVNGVLAGNTGSSESSNISFGYGALSNTTASVNTAIGNSALYSNTTGAANTANGDLALSYNTTGTNNTGIGGRALYNNTTGSYNTAIGFYADITGNLNFATAIGCGAVASSSYQVRIGSYDISSIGGYAAWTNFSDGRAKKNIRLDVPGLAFINRLQPVTYNLDLDVIDGLLNIDRTKIYGKDEVSPELIAIEKKARETKEKQIRTGFVAQDVEKIAQSIGYDFSGVDVDEIGIYGLRYAEFVVPLVKAVQELSEQNERMQAQINELLQEKAALRSGNAGESATGVQQLIAGGASLQQNSPNPFTQSTVIRYTLPQTSHSAQMVITATAGNVVRQIPLPGSGETGSVTIEGGALSAGIYYYSLYVDNRLIDTKQMILTK